MSEIKDVLEKFDQNYLDNNKHIMISFTEYLEILKQKPEQMFRDVFQLFHDMVHYYVPNGINEYPDDPESINYVNYDYHRLFVKGSDNPYFADRLFGNRFMNLINSYKHGGNRNKIYLFEGPPGSGKSIFLKNLLYRFQRYLQCDEGEVYETLWRIDKRKLMFDDEMLLQASSTSRGPGDQQNLAQSIASLISHGKGNNNFFSNSRHIIVPCPNHDHPILQIPKAYRKTFLRDLIPEGEFKEKLLNEKKYLWIFKDEPCTICSSIFEAILDKVKSPTEVLNMLYPRRMRFNRRLGEGVSVYNTGDEVENKPIINPALQQSIDALFEDSNKVKYVHSSMAKTNNGIYVIMDVKHKNQARVTNLHGVISDGIHKVGTIEENIKSIFIGLINPQDKKFIEENESLKDRIIYIKMPYVLDFYTEVSIYKSNFGDKIIDYFLPGVLENFAKVIISSRLSKQSEGLKELVTNPTKYAKYCDPDLHLLKMDLFTGKIPDWIGEDDRRKFNAKLRKKIISEGEKEGQTGFSGRESIHVFNNFMSHYVKEGKLINMAMVYDYFIKHKENFKDKVSDVFLNSLVNSYDYTILQKVKECLYSYNVEEISINIQDYIFAMNFDIGATATSSYTDQKLEITEGYLKSIEDYLIGANVSQTQRLAFREDVLKRYTSITLTREILQEKKKLTETELYKELHQRYMRNLKNNALDPFLENENFRNAIKEYNTKEFSAHDKKIRKDVTFLIKNLEKKFTYSEDGAKEICIYVIDKNLATKFKD